MEWKNNLTPTFAGSAGSNKAPDVAESMTLYDRFRTSIAAQFVKTVAGVFSLQVGGYDVLTTQTGIRVAHSKYDFSVDGGAQGTITPSNGDTIPDNAILVGATINSTSAVTSDGSATVAIGTSAGSSTTAIKGATGKASYSADAVLNGVPVFATPVKLTAAGQPTFTIGTADLTAGVIELWVYYVVAAA